MARWWEGLFKGGKEAGEIGVKIAGKSTADIAKEAAEAAKDAGKTAERVEPSMGKATDTAATPKPDTKPRVNPNSPEYKDFLAKEKATKEAAEKAAAEKAAAEKTAADAATQADNSLRLTWWRRTKMFYGFEGRTLNSELSAIARRNGGVVKDTDKAALADMEKVLSKHRLKGIPPDEATALQNVKGVPDSIKAKAQKYADGRDPDLRTIVGHTTERWASKLDFFLHYPVFSVAYFGLTPVRAAAAIGAKSVSRIGLTTTAGIVAVADGLAHYAFADEKDKNIISAGKAVGHDAVTVVAAPIRFTAWGLSKMPGDWAKEQAEKLIRATPAALMGGLNFADKAGTGMIDGVATGIKEQTEGSDKGSTTGTTQKTEGKDMGLVTHEITKKIIDGVEKKVEAKTDETGLPNTSATTAPTAGTPAADSTAPAPDAKAATEDDLDEEELEKFKGLSGPQKLLFLKNKGKELAKQGSDALSGGEMKKLKDLAETGGFMGLLGGLMGFMGGGSKGAKLMNALGLGALFGMLGDMLGIPHTLNLGGGGNSRSAMRSHNNYMANGQQAYADMGRGTQPNPNALYDDHGRLLVNTARPPQNQPVYNTPNQTATTPAPQSPGGIDQGNGVTTYPVASVAKQIDPNGTVRTDADLHTAATTVLPPAPTTTPVAQANTPATNDPSQRTVQIANGAPQYVYGAAQVDDNKPVPLVMVDGHTRTYGETAPAPQQAAATPKRDNVMELTPSLG